jgi:MFS family permease
MYKSRHVSILALNFISALAQFGQYGLGVTLIPIALKARNASVESIGFTSAAFWFGMLFGLLIAGHLTRKLGYRTTLIFGLILSAISFALMPLMPWHLWILPASTIGVGLGLRWIALETWLYNLVPVNARGRIVGMHETLLAFSAILGPLLLVSMDAIKPDAFWIAATVILSGLVVLPLVSTVSAQQDSLPNKPAFKLRDTYKFWLGFGALIAGFGGYIEGSLLAFIPVYVADIGFTPADAAFLLTLFQVGAMAFQYPIGWMADHHGLLRATKLCTVIAIASLLLALGFGHQHLVLSIAIFFMGGAIASTLSLGIIWAIHNNTGATITNKVRQVSIVYTTFSAAGPLITGLIISQLSSSSLFWQQLVIMLILIIVVIKQTEIAK